MIENITTLQRYLKVYPPDDHVFADPVAQYARHLLPLVSIDLSAVDPSWKGWIHMVNSVEPEDGMLGEDTTAFHNYYLRENWIGFHLNQQGRYELLGDFRYFYLENPPDTLPEAYPGQRQALEEHDAIQHAGLEEARLRFARHGVLYSARQYASKDRDLTRERPCALVHQLGGGVAGGNWASGFPLDTSDEDNIRPLMPDGTRFHFVAQVTGWEYCASGADAILLFYEPESKTALLTFDWS
jgi:hypothetical protein